MLVWKEESVVSSQQRVLERGVSYVVVTLPALVMTVYFTVRTIGELILSRYKSKTNEAYFTRLVTCFSINCVSVLLLTVPLPFFEVAAVWILPDSYSANPVSEPLTLPVEFVRALLQGLYALKGVISALLMIALVKKFQEPFVKIFG